MNIPPTPTHSPQLGPLSDSENNLNIKIQGYGDQEEWPASPRKHINYTSLVDLSAAKGFVLNEFSQRHQNLINFNLTIGCCAHLNHPLNTALEIQQKEWLQTPDLTFTHPALSNVYIKGNTFRSSVSQRELEEIACIKNQEFKHLAELTATCHMMMKVMTKKGDQPDECTDWKLNSVKNIRQSVYSKWHQRFNHRLDSWSLLLDAPDPIYTWVTASIKFLNETEMDVELPVQYFRVCFPHGPNASLFVNKVETLFANFQSKQNLKRIPEEKEDVCLDWESEEEKEETNRIFSDADRDSQRSFTNEERQLFIEMRILLEKKKAIINRDEIKYQFRLPKKNT